MLLTDKEINHILDEWGKNPIGDYDTMVAKAQLKKVVEWLEEHHCGHPDGVIPEVDGCKLGEVRDGCVGDSVIKRKVEGSEAGEAREDRVGEHCWNHCWSLMICQH